MTFGKARPGVILLVCFISFFSENETFRRTPAHGAGLSFHSLQEHPRFYFYREFHYGTNVPTLCQVHRHCRQPSEGPLIRLPLPLPHLRFGINSLKCLSIFISKTFWNIVVLKQIMSQEGHKKVILRKFKNQCWV